MFTVIVSIRVEGLLIAANEGNKQVLLMWATRYGCIASCLITYQAEMERLRLKFALAMEDVTEWDVASVEHSSDVSNLLTEFILTK